MMKGRGANVLLVAGEMALKRVNDYFRRTNVTVPSTYVSGPDSPPLT